MAQQEIPVVQRIEKLELRNFRGFVGPSSSEKPHQLDTNADIVLLTGPNGYGKTSALQALTLLLTGHAELKDLSSISRASKEEDGEGGAAPLAPAMELNARVAIEVGSGEQRTVKVRWPHESDGPVFAGDMLPWPRQLTPRSRTLDGDPESETARQERERARELLARITSFYPERVDDLFESLTTGGTLRDIFFPMPEPVRKALDRLHEPNRQQAGSGASRASIEERIEKIRRSKGEKNVLEEERSDALESLKERWEPIRSTLAGLRASDLNSEWTMTFEHLSSIVAPELESLESPTQELLQGRVTERREVAKALVNAIVQILERAMQDAQREARRVQGAEDLESELADLKLRLEAIGRDYPDLDSDLACFAPSSAKGETVDLLTVLRSVGEERDRWLARAGHLRPKGKEMVALVLKELDAVIPKNAIMRAQELERWLVPRQKAGQDRKSFLARMKDVERELERYRVSEKLDRLKEARKSIEDSGRDFIDAYSSLYRAQRRIDLKTELDAAEKRLEEVLGQIDDAVTKLEQATGANEQILDHTAELATKVLERFSTVDGIVPLSVVSTEASTSEASYSAIKTASGLDMVQLSTGQKAQAAVSLAVAQSELLRRAPNIDLPFHVLVLDDVSTAYDLSNLTREAIIWRQLAYHEDKEQRWQIFISSHHEDLTNHLLDLLVPPQGATLRVLRFEGWSWETGPIIEPFFVEPSRQIDVQTREHIAESFKEILCQAS